MVIESREKYPSHKKKAQLSLHRGEGHFKQSGFVSLFASGGCCM